MVSKKILIGIITLLLLGLLLILFPGEAPKERAEFYDDPLLMHFGMTKEHITDRYGMPSYKGEIGGPGGEVLFYEDLNVSFIFAGGKNIVNNLEVFEGVEFFDVEVGMTFDEIEDVLGEPRERGYDHYAEDYTMVYFFGDEENGMGEVEVWFSADSDYDETRRAQIFWKKFWEK